jgi:hypothetical protein
MSSMWRRFVAVLVLGAFAISPVGGVARANPEPPGADVRDLAPPVGGLRLRAADPDVTLTYLLKTGQKDFGRSGPSFGPGPNLMISLSYFNPLCVAPCEVQLPPGDYVFGLTEGNSRILQSRRITLRGDETLTGRWVSRRLLRVGGAMVGLAALFAGFVMMSKRFRCHLDCDDMFPPKWLGPAVSITGAGLMIASQFAQDRAEIDVGP